MLLNPQAGPLTARYLLGFDLRRRPSLDADVIVIGGGIAGACAALTAANAGSEVLLLSKAPWPESNTAYAQGGLAAVLNPERCDPSDTLSQHIADTIAAGAGLCDDAVVADVLAGAEAGVDLLEHYGCTFDQDPDGRSALTREGGHKARRILHADGDGTGRVIAGTLQRAVSDHPHITVIEGAFALDLITDEQATVRGVLYHRRGEMYAALADSTIIATGGCGRVYRETTNPAVATGDGLAMAYRAGAVVSDMEFMQFHPTTLYIAGAARLLITEAMRGEGAHLVNNSGERFMQRFHPDAELAPRDVVSQAIVSEIASTDFPHVWLDTTHLDTRFLQQRFPAIYAACARLEINLGVDWIPVHPSAHYHCGGITTDAHGQTSLAGLYACGEAACTGLHGANRLASNSLLEGLVVGQRTGLLAHQNGGFPGRVRLAHDKQAAAPEHLDVADLARSVRSLMWRDVGIERHGTALATAGRTLRFWSRHQARGSFTDQFGWELQNLLIVSRLITAAAERRSASVGTHLRHDSDGPIGHHHYHWNNHEALT